MKKILVLLNTVAICGFLSISSPVIAQDANRTNTEMDDNDEEDMDYGWIGLIGLAGLLGLRKRDRVVDRDYTTTRPNTGTPPRS